MTVVKPTLLIVFCKKTEKVRQSINFMKKNKLNKIYL